MTKTARPIRLRAAYPHIVFFVTERFTLGNYCLRSRLIRLKYEQMWERLSSLHYRSIYASDHESSLLDYILRPPRTLGYLEFTNFWEFPSPHQARRYPQVSSDAALAAG